MSMKKLTVLVDLDDTVWNLSEPWIDTLNTTYGTNVQAGDCRDWDLTKLFPNLSRNQIYAPLHTEELWQNVMPLPGAEEYLKKMIHDGHDIAILTASHPDTIHLKMKIFNRYFSFIPWKNVIIASRKQLVRGDILIDDAPHNLVCGEYAGILFTAPHNRNYDAIYHGFLRADDWEDVYDLVCHVAHVS